MSLKWLQEFVPIDIPAEPLAEILSLSGTKVAAVHPPTHVEGVVVAEVRDIADHPNADTLTLVDVEYGGGRGERVVCGVRNFSIGDKVPYATLGARLPEITITERKIRGEVSRGMLCSAAELGVSKDHSGILVLSPDATVGQDVSSLLGLSDTVLELEVTPNRPDCMGMIGVAREVAALLGRELTVPDAGLDVAADVDGRVQVDIEDRVGCPRYLARFASVSIGPSPAWMAARLLAAGVRPISNVVDATNYVMIETGQPLHAFDAAHIHDRKIVVRRARRHERLTTLDGIDRELHPDDLLIADPKRALAFAGVMGGADSEVSDSTTEVILEAAYFEHVAIALTSRRHLLRTEASARFERGTDPEIVPYAAARALQLMIATSSASVSPTVVDAYPAPIERSRVVLRPDRSSAVLGFEIPADAQASHLRSVGLGVTEREDSLLVEVPGFRPDIRREEDLIEEVARLAGFEKLPSTLPAGRAGRLDPHQRTERRVRRVLAGAGLHETWTSSFMSSRDPGRLGLAEGHPAGNIVRLANPMSEDQDVLRTTLLPGMLQSVARNRAQHADGIALFEIARVYERSDEELPREGLVLGVALAGNRRPPSWTGAPEQWDFFSAKGIVESLVASLGTTALTFGPISEAPWHPTRGAVMSLGGVVVGVLGELHPDVCARFDVDEGTIAAELSLAPLFNALPERERVGDLPRFPAVYMDLAVVVDETVRARVVEDAIRSAGSPELERVSLFDVYRGEQVSSGKKSLAYALVLRVQDRTLTDEDAAVVKDRILAELRAQTGAELRT